MIKTSKINFEIEFENYTSEQIVNEIKRAMQKWIEYDFKNDALWKVFQDEFETYIENVFKLILKFSFSALRLFFRKRNVWIFLNREISITTILMNAFNKKKSIRWTNEKVSACHKKKRFTSNQLRKFVTVLKKNEMRYMKAKTSDRKNDRQISFLSSSNSFLRHQKREIFLQQSKH